MTKRANRARRRYTRGNDSAQAPRPSPWRAAADGLVRLTFGLAQYWQDLFGLILIAFALITLLGLLGLISGAITAAMTDFLVAGLGWGAALAPISAGAVGGLLLARNFGWQGAVHWGRVIAGEIAAFAWLGLLSLLTGNSLALAESGESGGVVGWAIGITLGDYLGPGTAGFLLGFMTLALGLYVSPLRLRHILWLWAQVEARLAPPEPELVTSSAVAVSPTAKAAASKPARKARLRIPAEFRQKVNIDTAVDEAPARPKKRSSRLPSLDLLESSESIKIARKEIEDNAAIIVKTLADFGLPAQVVGVRSGPVVTQYAVEPGFVERPGPDGVARRFKVRVSQISAVANDLAMALSAPTLRIEAPVPGQSYLGIEVPNRRTGLVNLRGVMESEAFQRINSPLAIALGRDVSGAPVAADLGGMPHLLIAGTTGSGKSVNITAMTTCLVANNTPDDLRLVMIDPKMVELVRFNGLPHLFGHVEVELDRIIGVLRWCTREMDRRYKLFELSGARNIGIYNKKIGRRKDAERLPRIVVMIDELADLMMLAPDETEKTIIRLAQMSRATGLHLIIATQRPSTDVVTGLIKANFPARISFAVASGIDSRVILDTPGAESLLGKGDMLFLAPDLGTPIRLQGCFVTDREVEKVVGYWREQVETQRQEAEAAGEAPEPEKPPWDNMLARQAVIENKDSQIEQAIAVVQQYGTASASLLQRKLRIGYPRAARLMDELHEMGIVGRQQTGGKTREVLIEEDDDPIGRAAGLEEE